MHYNLSAESISHIFSLSEKNTAFNQDEVFITLCCYSAIFFFYGYQFSFPGFWSQRGAPGRRIQKSSGFMALQIGSYSHLSSFLPLVSAPTCLQPTLLLYCFLFSSTELPPSWDHCQDMQLSLFSQFPATSLYLSDLLKNSRSARPPSATSFICGTFKMNFGD